MAALGWTWEYIDTCMTIPRLLALTEHWQESPPLHEAFAAFMGAVAGKERRTPHLAREAGASRGSEGGDGDFGKFLEAFGMLGGVVQVN